MSKLNRDWSAVARRFLMVGSAVAIAAGAGVWGAILLAPLPDAAPPALTDSSPVERPDTEPIARWFGAAAPSIKLLPSGLIAARNGGVAVLSIDGRRPQAYAAGQQLAADTWLAEVRATGIVVQQGSQRVEIELPRLPVSSGIVPTPATAPADLSR